MKFLYSKLLKSALKGSKFGAGISSALFLLQIMQRVTGGHAKVLYKKKLSPGDVLIIRDDKQR